MTQTGMKPGKAMNLPDRRVPFSGAFYHCLRSLSSPNLVLFSCLVHSHLNAFLKNHALPFGRA